MPVSIKFVYKAYRDNQTYLEDNADFISGHSDANVSDYSYESDDLYNCINLDPESERSSTPEFERREKTKEPEIKKKHQERINKEKGMSKSIQNY